jgi:hypothetical protein
MVLSLRFQIHSVIGTSRLVKPVSLKIRNTVKHEGRFYRKPVLI